MYFGDLLKGCAGSPVCVEYLVFLSDGATIPTPGCTQLSWKKEQTAAITSLRFVAHILRTSLSTLDRLT